MDARSTKWLLVIPVLLLAAFVYRTASDPYLHYFSARMRIAKQNLACADCILDADGKYGPYRRKVVVWNPETRTHAIVDDLSPLKRRYDPNDPYSDRDGFVFYPNVCPAIEKIEMLCAQSDLGEYLTGKSLWQRIWKAGGGGLIIRFTLDSIPSRG